MENFHFFYVSSNNSGTIQVRLGRTNTPTADQVDDPIVLDFLSNTNRAQTIAHRMNLSHWTVKEPKYAEPAIDVRGVPAS